jgi:hypothetical protein
MKLMTALFTTPPWDFGLNEAVKIPKVHERYRGALAKCEL